MAEPKVGDIVGVNYVDNFEYTLKIEITINASGRYSGCVKEIFGRDIGPVQPNAAILDKLLGKIIEFDASQIRPISP